MNWEQLSTASMNEVIKWAEEQPWSHAMAECMQDAEWHAEGDVWTHTKMVCSELTALNEWPDLSQRQRTVLLFTALLHDVAKPNTTQIDSITGRTTSPKHAVKGEHLARGILRGLGCELLLREEIARMVRLHGRPAFLLEKEQPNHEVVKLSWLVSNQLLYLFAVADTRGRDTAQTTRPEENLQLWKMIAEENHCFSGPYAFANPHARFQFFRKKEPSLHYVPHEDYSCKVTVLAGLPGCGKDQWLAKNRANEPVVSLDDIRRDLKVGPTENQGKVIQEAREQCRERLRAKTSFAFNATNVVRQTREQWINLFADYKAFIEIVYLEPPFEKILKQNAQRDDAVPEEVIRKLAAKTEVPTWAECHKLVLVET